MLTKTKREKEAAISKEIQTEKEAATSTIVASGIGWLQAIAIPAGVYAFYLFFTQPYVIESLSHPKDDPQGGFGHYIGDMVPLLLIIAFVATISMVVQDYRGGSRKF